MHRQQSLRFDPLDPVRPNLKPLRQIPQEKINKHAARARARGAQSCSDALDSDDRCGTYGDLLARAAREFFVRLERTGERGMVGEDAQVVQDLRDAVVGEHC